MFGNFGGWVRRGAIVAGILFSQPALFGADGTSIFDDNYKPPVIKHPVAPATEHNPPAPNQGPSPVNPSPVPPAPASSLPPTRPAPAERGEVFTGKLTAPDSTTKAQLLKLVKQIFESEYSAKSPEGKKVLAAVLLTEANKIKSNFPAKFVLLQESEVAALAAGDAAVCRQAIDGLDDTFTVDATAMTVEALAKLADTGASGGTLAVWTVDAIQRRIDQNDYQGAKRLIRATSPKLAKSNDAASVARIKAFDALILDYERLRPALDKLKINPNDPAANLAVGRFLCFYKLDWPSGLPMLAKGTDEKLKALAQEDVTGPSDAMARYTLAGKWWELGEGKAHATLQPACRERADYWYEKASPDLTGLEKVLAEKRMAELPPGSKTANILTQMIPEGPRVTTSDGVVRMNGGGLIRTPVEVTVPFRVEVVAMTDSNNIRIGFGAGQIILNWEGDPNQLRHHDPADGKPTAFSGKGHAPVNQWVQLTWIVEDGVSRVLVDGEERCSVKGKYRGLHSAISIFPMGSIVSVKSVNITQFKAKPETPLSDPSRAP